MNGIEVAQLLAQAGARCLIVFLTSSKEYAFDAFPVHPFDYLVKPYSAARLDHVLSGAIRLMEESEQLVEIHLPRQTIRLPHGQIVAVTSHGHALDIFTVFRRMPEKAHADLRRIGGRPARTRALSALQPRRARQHGRGAQARRRQHPADRRPALPLRQRNRLDLINRFSEYQIKRMKRGVTAMLFARYAAKLAIFYPFALLCYLPLSGFLRLPLKKLAALSVLGVTAFVGIGALACCCFQLSVNALLFPRPAALPAALSEIGRAAAVQGAVRLFSPPRCSRPFPPR